MSSDLSGEITAVATAVLAFATVALVAFAIITAYYARKAFREQSKEVKDQAAMLKVQSSRLGLQERQYEEQRTANRKRDELFDKQLREADQRARILDRQQAEAIDLTPTSTMRPIPGYDLEAQGRPHCADVANQSGRPIRDIACRIEDSPGTGLQEARLAGLYAVFPGAFSVGRSNSESLMLDAIEAPPIPLMRAGESGSFIFAVGTKQDPEARLTLRFTDDAGLHWQIDHDLHLQKLDNRGDW